MTFCAQVKQELCAHPATRPCCARAFCLGAAAMARELGPGRLAFRTESQPAARCLQAAFAARGVALRQEGCRVHGHQMYSLWADDDCRAALDAFWAACGIPAAALPAADLAAFSGCGRCAGAWLAGAFMCGGFIADPAKEYLLEFVSLAPQRLAGVRRLLEGAGLAPRETQRAGASVVYLRASESIVDLLALMGAGHCAMRIMDVKIRKDYRNQANRITNCETANIDKSVAANQRVLQAIRLLEAAGALQRLPQPLQDAAAARLADPAATLAELAAGMVPPVSKSGLAHRMKKLTDAAGELARGAKRP